MGLCKSDSWAPPVSLLRAASRDPNGQPTATQALPLLRLSLLLVSGLAIGWFTLLVSCLSSSVLFRLVSLHSLVSRYAPSLCSSSRTINRLNHDCRQSVRIYYRRPFAFQRPVPHTGSSNHQPQAPLSCFDKTNHQHLFPSTSHSARVCVVDLFGESPWFLD